MEVKKGRNTIKLSGKVDKILMAGIVVVVLTNDVVISCHLSKKIKKFNLNIIPGDIVDVEISPYDLTKGRIVHRYINK